MIVCCHSGRLGDFFGVAFFFGVCFTVQNASALMEDRKDEGPKEINGAKII